MKLTPHRRVVLAQAMGQGSVLLATPLLSRRLPVEELGTYQTALAIALALQPIATLRVDFVLPGVTDDLVAAGLIRRGQRAGFLLLALAFVIGGFFVACGSMTTAKISFCAGALAIAYSWLALDGGRFIRTQELNALTVRNLASGLAAALLQCVVAFVAPTAIALTAAIVAARLIAVGLSRAKVSSPAAKSTQLTPVTDPYPPRRLVPAVATSLLDTTILQSLVVVPGAFLGARAAGYTGMSQRITTSPASLVVGGIGQVAQAKVSAAIRSGNRSVFAALKPTLLRLGGVAAVLGLAVALVAPFLVVPVLGPQWVPLQHLLPITAPALAMQLISLTLVPVGMMLGAEISLLLLNIGRLLVIVGGTLLTALVTHDLTATVVCWSATTTVGYCCQLGITLRAAMRHDGELSQPGRPASRSESRSGRRIHQR